MYVTLNDIFNSFGTDNLNQQCLDFYNSHDWLYEFPSSQEKDSIILKILKFIESDKKVIGSKERTKEWDDGWKENLDEFLITHRLESIYPKFFHANQPVRFNNNFIKTANPNFERDYATLYIMWLASKYVEPYDNIYEFGCGSGFNMIIFTAMYPSKRFIGSDFSPSAIQLIKEISNSYNLNTESHFFDMIVPDYSFDIKPNSVVFTIGSIEQLASKYQPIVDYWLYQKPALVVHCEPTIEFLNSDNLLDYLSIKYMKNRDMSQGFLTHLRKLSDDGIIEILKEKRLFFGSLLIEGWNYIVWKPVEAK